MRLLFCSLLILALLLGCATVPPATYSDENPRFDVVGMQYPFGGMILIILKDRETGKLYVIAALKDNGMSVVEVR